MWLADSFIQDYPRIKMLDISQIKIDLRFELQVGHLDNELTIKMLYYTIF